MLDAAARLFGTQRFHEVRMEDIAAEAQVAKGTIYRYFADKEELFLALLERSSVQVVRRVEERLGGAASVRARLEALVQAVIDFFDEQPHLFDLIQRAEVIQQPGKTSPWQHTRDDLARLAMALFEEAKQQGEFTIRDPSLAVRMLLGGLRSVIRFGPKPRPPLLVRNVVADFLSGASMCSEGTKPGAERNAL
jgi:TetR/AcrR family transcriptional regulator